MMQIFIICPYDNVLINKKNIFSIFLVIYMTHLTVLNVTRQCSSYTVVRILTLNTTYPVKF